MRYKVGLHSSHMGGGVLLNPVSIWPLSKKYRSVAFKKLNREIKETKKVYWDASGRALKP